MIETAGLPRVGACLPFVFTEPAAEAVAGSAPGRGGSPQSLHVGGDAVQIPKGQWIIKDKERNQKTAL